MPLLHPAILLACISESHHYPGPWVVHLTLRVNGLYSPRIDHILVSHHKCVGGKNGDSPILCVSCRVEPWPGPSGSAFASVDPSQADRSAAVYSTGHERLLVKWAALLRDAFSFLQRLHQCCHCHISRAAGFSRILSFQQQLVALSSFDYPLHAIEPQGPSFMRDCCLSNATAAVHQQQLQKTVFAVPMVCL